MCEGFSQRFAAGDDVGEIREVDSIGWRLRLIGYRENITPVLMMARNRSSASSNLRTSLG
jgi:hypothetical protein